MRIGTAEVTVANGYVTMEIHKHNKHLGIIKLTGIPLESIHKLIMLGHISELAIEQRRIERDYKEARPEVLKEVADFLDGIH